MKPLLHIISHTDLDGVAAAALAWHAHYQDRKPLKVSLTGYGEVDNLILESLEKRLRHRDGTNIVVSAFVHSENPYRIAKGKTTESIGAAACLRIGRSAGITGHLNYLPIRFGSFHGQPFNAQAREIGRNQRFCAAVTGMIQTC